MLQFSDPSDSELAKHFRLQQTITFINKMPTNLMLLKSIPTVDPEKFREWAM